MAQLAARLETLAVKLDHMGLRVEQILADALQAVETGDQQEAQGVIDSDELIDRHEVEIELECIRLLALYQPTAVDLRRICFIIKVNSDLERMADLAVSIARFAPRMHTLRLPQESSLLLDSLKSVVTQTLHKTLRLLNRPEIAGAHEVIERDREIDKIFRLLIGSLLDRGGEDSRQEDTSSLFALLNVARSLERLGDLSTNIAEDVIFLETGEIVRHTVK